jgi:hypothetical protein
LEKGRGDARIGAERAGRAGPGTGHESEEGRPEEKEQKQAEGLGEARGGKYGKMVRGEVQEIYGDIHKLAGQDVKGVAGLGPKLLWYLVSSKSRRGGETCPQRSQG